jgi:hypothetical protein
MEDLKEFRMVDVLNVHLQQGYINSSWMMS